MVNLPNLQEKEEKKNIKWEKDMVLFCCVYLKTKATASVLI